MKTKVTWGIEGEWRVQYKISDSEEWLHAKNFRTKAKAILYAKKLSIEWQEVIFENGIEIKEDK